MSVEPIDTGGNVVDQLRGERDVAILDRRPTAIHDRLRTMPGPRNELDGIESEPDQQIAFVDQRLLDDCVREHAGKIRIVVRHDALGFVGDHRGDARRGAERANRGRGRPIACVEAGDDERPL